ncbi:MAG: GNAT family N-acetyltransferase [Gemmatimonadales bacterium]|nr:GNAT family N-acetyltransferase [Gemmatimonadales bacterium]
MDARPDLLTPRLVLRPLREAAADVDRLHALLLRAEVRRYLCDDRVLARDEVAALLADAAAAAPQGLGLWWLSAAADPACAGCAGLLPVTTAAAHEPRLAGLVEPLVALAPEAWGRGYAAEALGALVAHAFGALGLVRLAGVTDAPNAASARMLERCGFQPLSEVEGPLHRLRTFLLERPA